MSPSLPLRILYLEDDPLDAELAILRLEENEFACDWHRVATQDEFIASLENGAYDLILADYNLPTFTGLEALKLFTETNLDIPFIIVSGNLWEELAVETLKLGATDYVLKDRLSRLGLAVRRALDEKQIQRQRRADAQKIQHLLQHQMAANQLSIALGDARQLEDVYQIIHEYVRDLMRVDTFIISSFSHQTNLIHAKYVFTNGQVCDVTAYPPIPLNESENGGPQSQVIITGKAIYYPDYLAAIEASKTLYHISDTGQVNKTHPISEYEEPVTRSAIFAPIKEKGETVGVIQVQSHELEGYEQDDVDILAALANVAAIAIQNASLLENTQRQLHKLEALHNIDVAISASIDVQITLNILLEQVEAHLNADACSIALLPANANMLDYKSVRGFRSQTLAYSMFRLGEGLAGRVALERKIIHIEDLSQLDEEGIQPFIREQFLTYYGLPLISKGQVKGVL
ncbi:MAG: GAF domain-containing protein, partial [Chloroflexi bacterium]|nr:GAF domain-containing protein [Chloroflexota bacterium]